MNESEFGDGFHDWLARVLEEWKDEQPRAKVVNLSVCKGIRPPTGWLAWRELATGEWVWRESTREIDVAVVIDALIKSAGDEKAHPIQIPLFAVELKTGKSLGTDELDKKSAIYGRLREIYPFVRTALVVAEYGANREHDRLVHNSRHFDYVITEWSKHSESKRILKDAIRHHLDYSVVYWQS